MGYQRKVADAVRGRTGLSVDDCKSTPAGVNGPDLTLSSVGQKAFPYSVELKYCRTISVPSWLRQARDGAYEGTTPIVVFREFKDKKDYAIIPFQHFMELAAPGLMHPCSSAGADRGTETCLPSRVCSQAKIRPLCLA